MTYFDDIRTKRFKPTIKPRQRHATIQSKSTKDSLNDKIDEPSDSSLKTPIDPRPSTFVGKKTSKRTKSPKENIKKRSAGKLIESPPKISRTVSDDPPKDSELVVLDDDFGDKREKCLATLAFESHMASNPGLYDVLYPSLESSFQSKYPNSRTQSLPQSPPIETRAPAIIITPSTPPSLEAPVFGHERLALKGNERDIIDSIEKKAYEKATRLRSRDSINDQLEKAKEKFEEKKAQCTKKSFYSRLSSMAHKSRIANTAVGDGEIVVPGETQESLYDSAESEDDGQYSTTYRTAIDTFEQVQKRPRHWSFVETEMFYIVLEYCGSNFRYMSEFLEDRSIKEIHKKFLHESAYHPWRITQCLLDE
ncbi:hypothetical protein CLU79DRAFT_889025 [Phycomyces nitens]|nr:hypothetical protein CLU79DRAFT_889025 [Phycomyces nitens]